MTDRKRRAPMAEGETTRKSDNEINGKRLKTAEETRHIRHTLTEMDTLLIQDTQTSSSKDTNKYMLLRCCKLYKHENICKNLRKC